MENLIIVGLAANLVTTVVGVSVLGGQIKKAGEWKGWAETKIKSNCSRITKHGEKIDNFSERLAKHEGASNG